jgi:hypothetical protein
MGNPQVAPWFWGSLVGVGCTETLMSRAGRKGGPGVSEALAMGLLRPGLRGFVEVGLAGIEPATSALSGISGKSHCVPMRPGSC